jgi:polynucleotide 5'-hydroxyl-kinase GRC3/NOL9
MGFHPTVSPPEWNEVLSISASERSKHGKASVTMICGPKSSGKSTFSRLLINRLLTTPTAQERDSSIAFLDLDPGQPEFSPPGQLSLHLLSEPNFGPPFSHPDSSTSGTKLIRAHSIAAASPASDPSFYSTCATDLYSYYVKLLLPMHCPLVINTPGWILGTGLELLINLIRIARPTQVIYMSQDGPREAVESLHDALKSSPVLTLPSQSIEYLPRTSTHLRTMQYMSYFHQDATTSGNRVWNSDPVTSLAPLEVTYAGKAAGILGIMCLGEQPPISMVRDTIDGSLVALVVIEDMAAIPSSKSNEEGQGSIQDPFGEDTSMNMNDNGEKAIKPQFAEQSYRRPENSLILHAPEGIPYLNPAIAVSLNPTYSYTIGLALVRGIDVRRQRLQLLTPIPANSIKDIRASGKAIILVSGKLDAPGWAYLEALYKKDADMKEDNKRRDLDEGTHDSGVEEGEDEVTGRQPGHTDGFRDTPWIEVLQGDKGRDVGARVWRVRRDLGKTGEGG